MFMYNNFNKFILIAGLLNFIYTLFSIINFTNMYIDIILFFILIYYGIKYILND